MGCTYGDQGFKPVSGIEKFHEPSDELEKSSQSIVEPFKE